MFVRTIAGAAVITVALITAPKAQHTDSGAATPPTEALHQALEALVGTDRAQQQVIASTFLGKARKTGLPAEEDVALGELYFLALDPVAADAIFSKYLDRADRVGRMAWIRHQQIQFMAFDRHDEAEAGIAVFRARFPVSPDDLTYTSQMVGNQARRYAGAGNHAKAVELILAAVKDLPLDTPMRAFLMPATFYQSFVEAGRADEARAILTAHRDRLRQVVATAGSPLEAASVIKTRPVAHRAGVLHADWDTGALDDAPDFSRARFNAQMALDRLAQLESRRAPQE